MAHKQQIVFFLLGYLSFYLRSIAAFSGLDNLVITLLSQKHTYHIQQAAATKASILDSCVTQNISCPIVHLAHEDFRSIHYWTVFPVLPILSRSHGQNATWFLFGTEAMDVQPTVMASMLSKFNSKEMKAASDQKIEYDSFDSLIILGWDVEKATPHEHLHFVLELQDLHYDVFLGRSLRDREPTIIHHFAFHTDPGRFAFPDLSAGFVLSVGLLNRLARRYSAMCRPPVDFSIDPMHELALFVWQSGEGTALMDPGALCTAVTDMAAAGCATSQRAPPVCTGRVDESTVHFAVKTCSQFHQSRLPVVRDTWAGDAVHVQYFSDVTDELLGTVGVGLANTERGHCAKTMRILQLSAAVPGLRWLVVADDDTILRCPLSKFSCTPPPEMCTVPHLGRTRHRLGLPSKDKRTVPRLHDLLTCYNADDALLLGERYGFHTSGRSGYDYITGGGGMVFSAEAVRRLTAHPGCRCPSPDSADDMHLGVCAATAGVTLVHSPRFHQARPPDYPDAVLAGSRPVSFHKHWMIDPREAYRVWLHDPRPTTVGHSEL